LNLENLKNYGVIKEELLSLEILENQGLNNTNYLLKTPTNEYIVRKFKSNNSVNISRKFEYDIQKKASNHNIASKPIFLNKDFMIYKYTKGIHKNRLSKTDIKNLVLKMKKFHSFKISTKFYDLSIDLQDYKKQLKDSKSQKIVKESFKILKKLKRYKVHRSLVHHDLNPKNIIFNNNDIKIIDWEYAGTNDIFFDLATICIEYNLKKEDEEIFLNRYFGKKKSFYKIKLNYYKLLYKNICHLWFEKSIKSLK